MSEKPQSFENHAKFVRGYHVIATLLLMVPTLFFLYRAVTSYSTDTLMLAAFAVGVVLIGLYARVFPLGVQDRLIRLEERMRMERLFPDDMQGHIGEFTTEQLVGLRFASDGELVELSRRVLTEGIADRKTIKSSVREWRADHQRI